MGCSKVSLPKREFTGKTEQGLPPFYLRSPCDTRACAHSDRLFVFVAKRKFDFFCRSSQLAQISQLWRYPISRRKVRGSSLELRVIERRAGSKSPTECPSKYSVLSSAESFSTLSNELLKNTSLLLPVNSLLFNPRQSSPLCYAPPRIATGLSMPSDPLPGPRRS